jgi:hypothetical protein
LIGWLRSTGRWVLRWLPWILLVIAMGIAATFAYLWWQHESEARTKEEVEEVSTEFLNALTDFSADTIEQDVEEIKSYAVGNFADEVDTFFGPDGIELIKEAEATSEGDVQAVYVQSLGEGTASVFALVNETITNVDVSDPATDKLRVEIELIETKDDGWKVQAVQVLQAPGGGLLGGGG